jgi:hypothetical protein
MSSPSLQSADWADVLEQIRTALDSALSATSAHERALPAEEPQPRAQLSPGDAEAHIGRLRELAERARARQAEHVAALAEGEERLRCWLAEAVAARQRLAEWASRSIG